MSDKLKTLLSEMSTDASLLSRFRSSPGQVLDEMGIEGEAREAVEAGDVDKLRALIGPEDPIAAGVFVVVYVREH